MRLRLFAGRNVKWIVFLTALGVVFFAIGSPLGAADPPKLVITSAVQTLQAGVASDVITVERQDGAGNAIVDGPAITASLLSTSASGAFSDGTSAITTVD